MVQVVKTGPPYQRTLHLPEHELPNTYWGALQSNYHYMQAGNTSNVPTVKAPDYVSPRGLDLFCDLAMGRNPNPRIATGEALGEALLFADFTRQPDLMEKIRQPLTVDRDTLKEGVRVVQNHLGEDLSVFFTPSIREELSLAHENNFYDFTGPGAKSRTQKLATAEALIQGGHMGSLRLLLGSEPELGPDLVHSRVGNKQWTQLEMLLRSGAAPGEGLTFGADGAAKREVADVLVRQGLGESLRLMVRTHPEMRQDENLARSIVRQEKWDMAKVLLEEKTDSMKDAEIRSQIPRSGRIDLIKLLLLHEENPRTKSSIAQCAMTEVVSKGNLHAVRYLMEESGCHLGDWDGVHLGTAAMGGHKPIVEYFLTRNPRTEKVSDALFQAASEGQVATLEPLHRHLPDVDLRRENDQLLARVSLEGHYEVAAYLLQHGVVPGEIDGGASLHNAAREGNTRIVELLHTQGRHTHEHFQAALESAQIEGKAGVVDYLSLNTSARPLDDAALSPRRADFAKDRLRALVEYRGLEYASRRLNIGPRTLQEMLDRERPLPQNFIARVLEL